MHEKIYFMAFTTSLHSSIFYKPFFLSFCIKQISVAITQCHSQTLHPRTFRMKNAIAVYYYTVGSKVRPIMDLLLEELLDKRHLTETQESGNIRSSQLDHFTVIVHNLEKKTSKEINTVLNLFLKYVKYFALHYYFAVVVWFSGGSEKSEHIQIKS